MSILTVNKLISHDLPVSEKLPEIIFVGLQIDYFVGLRNFPKGGWAIPDGCPMAGFFKNDRNYGS